MLIGEVARWGRSGDSSEPLRPPPLSRPRPLSRPALLSRPLPLSRPALVLSRPFIVPPPLPRALGLRLRRAMHRIGQAPVRGVGQCEGTSERPEPRAEDMAPSTPPPPPPPPPNSCPSELNRAERLDRAEPRRAEGGGTRDEAADDVMRSQYSSSSLARAAAARFTRAVSRGLSSSLCPSPLALSNLALLFEVLRPVDRKPVVYEVAASSRRGMRSAGTSCSFMAVEGSTPVAEAGMLGLDASSAGGCASCGDVQGASTR